MALLLYLLGVVVLTILFLCILKCASRIGDGKKPSDDAKDASVKTKNKDNVAGDMKIKPVSVLVVLHDPSQPANMRTKSITIPLGQSSTVYITPSATETDTSGQMLGETQRECRLKQENDNLKVFREVLTNSKTNNNGFFTSSLSLCFIYFL